MSTKNATVTKPTRVCRDEGLDRIIAALATGLFVRISHVAAGKGKPYENHMVVRGGVHSPLKGGHARYDANKQGLLPVFEVVNRETALQLFHDEHKHKLEELLPQYDADKQEATKLGRSSFDARAAAAAPASTKKETRTLASASKKATKEYEKAIERLQKLQVKLARERLALSNPLQFLLEEIAGRIENRTADIVEVNAQIAATTDPEKKAELKAEIESLERRLATEKKHKLDPVLSLMHRFRNIHRQSIFAAEIDGEQIHITTPTLPARPKK